MGAENSGRPDWLSEELYPFRSRYIELSGHGLHYIDEGQGPVLLLLHGNPTWSFIYRDIIKALRGEFRCVAPDYPGFGLSEAAPGFGFGVREQAGVIQEFVRALDLREIRVMVQDWGGPIGLHTAAAEPERFAGFIIGNTWCWPVTGDRHFRLFSKFFGGAFGRFIILRFNAFVNMLLPAGVKRGKISTAVMTHYRAPFPTPESRLPTNIFPREIVTAEDFLAEAEAGLARQADKPALILWGDKDVAFRAKERKRFEEIFSNSKTRILKGAGHFIQEDAPIEISKAIREWAGKSKT